jgi:hypothetical protein
VLSPEFANYEFQNWRLNGEPRLKYPYFWGDPYIFKERFANIIINWKTLYPDFPELMHVIAFNDYMILELEQGTSKCLIHLPATRSSGILQDILYLSDHIPSNFLIMFKQCDKIDIIHDSNVDNVITIEIYNASGMPMIIKVKERTIIIPLTSISKKEIIFKNPAWFSVWFEIDKNKISALPAEFFEILDKNEAHYIRILDEEGNVVYYNKDRKYHKSELMASSARYIAISGIDPGEKDFNQIQIKYSVYDFEMSPRGCPEGTHDVAAWKINIANHYVNICPILLVPPSSEGT